MALTHRDDKSSDFEENFRTIPITHQDCDRLIANYIQTISKCLFFVFNCQLNIASHPCDSIILSSQSEFNTNAVINFYVM